MKLKLYIALMRDHILAEVKRIATAAGGKAPGRRTFEKETGISASKWHGVYWARWSDVLTEAGLTANDKNKKLDGDLLLSKMAHAVRHFGRVPTFAELRIYGRNDPNFPAKNTLANHYPAKNDLVSALRNWLVGRDGYEDIISLLPTKIMIGTPDIDTVNKSTKIGFVYLIKSGEFYKVGRSDDIERRFRQISIALPDKSELFHAIRTDDPSGIEAYWHRRFADRRANGEWFKLMPLDVAAFRKRRFQ